ncbi:MAG: alanine dehydrogenase [Gammaproteobacteria bacterium]
MRRPVVIVGSLLAAGHDVLLENNAGSGSGYDNQEYQALGIEIVTTNEAWKADLVIKIKEPLEQEFQYFSDNILFTYLHLAGVPKSLTTALIDAGTTAIAYETVESNEGGFFPLLAPMSAVAGNMAATVGAYYLANFNQGKGIQLGRILGERNGKVMVIGNGIVGQHAAITADGLGANVFILGRDERKFIEQEKSVSDNITFVKSTQESIEEHIQDTDLLIGAVLLPGAKAPHLVSETMVKQMQAGSVIVDVAIDQGGCVETSHITSHTDPIFIKHDVVHYCVSNMPGAYPRTSTIALTRATLPYITTLANQGSSALRSDKGFVAGVNVCKGHITYKSVAESLNMGSLYKAFFDID